MEVAKQKGTELRLEDSGKDKTWGRDWAPLAAAADGDHEGLFQCTGLSQPNLPVEAGTHGNPLIHSLADGE